jgi:hypothetical protein
MRTILERAHDFSSIGTFVLTIVIVVLMVIPMLLHPANPSQDSIPVPGGHRMIDWIMPSILALSLILAGVLHFLAARETRKPSPVLQRAQLAPPPRAMAPQMKFPAATPPIVLSDKRILITISPLELFKFFDGHTSIEADRLLQPYFGKWMQISGEVNSVVHVVENITQVSFYLDKGRIISMSFAEPWFDTVSMLRKGAKVTVLGQLKRVEEAGIVALGNCEIVG